MIDLARMRRARHARVTEQMRRQGVDAVVLVHTGNLAYCLGADFPSADPARANHDPVIAVVPRDGQPHVFTRHPERIPGTGPDDLQSQVLPAIYPEADEGVAQLISAIRDIGGAGRLRVGFDDMSAQLFLTLQREAPDIEVCSAGEVLVAAKVIKTEDEVECLNRAQEINELALYSVYESFRPGVSQSELTGIFLEEIYGRGAEHNILDPVFEVMARDRRDGPFSVNGDVVFPTATTDSIMRGGDLVFVDSSVSIGGYHSDVGRTWIVGCDSAPEQPRQWFERWVACCEAVLEVTAPGATGADLTRAAHLAEPTRKPWFDQFYLAHGVGTESSEMPWIGTDRGPAFDAALELRAGMVFMLEPVIWEEGSGGYRSEEMVLVTDTGYRMIQAKLPYFPFSMERTPWAM